jgi:vitamin B12 transporter
MRMEGVGRLAKAVATVAVVLAWTAGGGAAQRPDFALDTLRVRVGSRAWHALPEATRTVDVIDRARIASSPASTVADLLAWALGVDPQPRSPAQADVSIRGSSFEQVLVLVDGVRVSDAQTAHFDLDLAVPLDEIERIEVLRGPATTQYGSDAMGGVIHIVTRRASASSARLEGGTDATWTAAAGAGASLGDATTRLGFDIGGSDGTRPGTDYRTAQLRGAVAAPLAGGTLRGDGGYAARDFGAADFYAPYDSYEETRVWTASVAWAEPSAGDDRFTVEPRLSLRRHEDDFILLRDEPEVYHNRHTNWLLGGEVEARARVGEDARLAFGGELLHDRIDSNALGERDATRGAVFGEIAGGGVGRWLGQTGVRVDWHSEFGTFLAPSAALAFWPAERLRLRASVGRSFRAPGWTDRYYRDPANIGDPDLKPERAWSGEVGAHLALSRVRLDVAAWARAAEQLIDWARPVGAAEDEPWHTMNVEDATFRGLEASLTAAGPFETTVSVQAAVLSVDATDADGFTSKYALSPLAQSVGASIDRAIGRGFGIGARARHARRIGQDDHLLADVRASYALGRIRAYVDLTNLTDAEYVDVSAETAPGRQLRVGVRWDGR